MAIAQVPVVHQVHAVTGGADLVIDLVAALQLALVIDAKGAVEAEAAGAGVGRPALRQGGRRRHQAEGGDRRSDQSAGRTRRAR